jgi:hypothetical protein
MNAPTKTVGPPLTPLPAHKSTGALESVLDSAEAVIDGNWPTAAYPLRLTYAEARRTV